MHRTRFFLAGSHGLGIPEGIENRTLPLRYATAVHDHLSWTGKHWTSRNASSIDVLPVLSEHTVEEYLRRSRGIANAKIELPKMLDLQRAAERIRLAWQHKETIGVFGDYDCDGITAAAQMIRMCERRGIQPIVRLPHRVHDGYGLSLRIVDELSNAGMRLLITVDTGISALEPIAMLQQRGIDVIVVDHHHVQEEVPNAYALVHPALVRGFPAPHPSGSGMAYLLLEAIEEGAWEDMHTDRALAMMGTVADLVELKGINRMMVQRGLLSLRDIREGPLAALRDDVSKNAELTSSDIAFRIAPRINAAGRMDDPLIALDALLRGGAALERLHHLNHVRQDLTESFVKQAMASTPIDLPLMASCSDRYPHGIIGLIAGALTEATGKPSIVGTIAGGSVTASLRSPKTYNVTQGLTRIAHHLTSYGGHAQAAGCSFPTSVWTEVTMSLAQDIADQTQGASLRPTIEIDGIIDSRDISLRFIEKIKSLEPFGQGNPEPRFLLRNTLPTNVRRVGNDGSHLQARIGGKAAIGFRLGNLHDRLNTPIDILCRLGINTWQGRTEAQIVVEDVQHAALVNTQCF